MAGADNSKSNAVSAKKMAAVSVIANPLAPTKDGVLIFQSGDTSFGLRVSPRNIKDDTVITSIGAKNRADVARPLVQPGQIVAFKLFDTIQVYGITGEKPEDQRVQLLSPVQEFLDPIPSAGALAGCSRPDGKRAWLYLITKDDDGNPNIIEWEVSKSAPDQRALSCDDFHLETNLYAVYDEELDTSWLIYQKKDKSLVVFDTKKDRAYTVDNSASRVLDKTPLAAAIVPVSGDKSRRLVLYFIDAEQPKRKYLSSANAILGQKTVSFDTPAERPKVLELEEGKHNLQDWAGMSTYVDADGQRVILFALTTKVPNQEPVFKAIPHAWSKVPGSD